MTLLSCDPCIGPPEALFASAGLFDLVAAFLSHTHALGMTKGKQYNTSQQLLQENNNISQQLPAHDVEKGIWEIGNVTFTE